MLKQLALKIGDYEITAPPGIPRGGIGTGETIIANSIQILIVVAILFCLFMIIYGGITWITSQGDKTKVQSARNKIIYAIFGLILIFFSFFIINLIGHFFGVELL